MPTGLNLYFGDLFMTPVRRSLLKGAAALGALSAAPLAALAQSVPTPTRRFEPR